MPAPLSRAVGIPGPQHLHDGGALHLDLQAIGKFRSHYYQDFTGNTAQQNRYYDDNASVDLRLRYRVNKQLSLSLELMNLTNEPRVAYQPLYGNFREVVSYGRRAYFGVRYKF